MAALRPQPITRAGQGGRRSPFSASAPRSGAIHSCGGSQAQGRRTLSGFSINANPVASARPSAWLAMPGLPSCSTHTVGAGALAAAASHGGGFGSAKERATIAPVYGKRVDAASRPGHRAIKLRDRTAKFIIPADQARRLLAGQLGWRSMRNPKLDRTDRLILRELQADGSLTNIELARRVGLSPPPCLRRGRARGQGGDQH